MRSGETKQSGSHRGRATRATRTTTNALPITADALNIHDCAVVASDELRGTPFVIPPECDRMQNQNTEYNTSESNDVLITSAMNFM